MVFESAFANWKSIKLVLFIIIAVKLNYSKTIDSKSIEVVLLGHVSIIPSSAIVKLRIVKTTRENRNILRAHC